MANSNSVSSITVLSRFHYPNILDILPLLFLVFKISEGIEKNFELRVIYSLGNMESQGESVKYV